MVSDEAVVQNSIIFAGVHIGKNCHIENCIIEKDVHIPDTIEIGLDNTRDRSHYHMTENGLRVIPKFFSDFV